MIIDTEDRNIGDTLNDHRIRLEELLETYKSEQLRQLTAINRRKDVELDQEDKEAIKEEINASKDTCKELKDEMRII